MVAAYLRGGSSSPSTAPTAMDGAKLLVNQALVLDVMDFLTAGEIGRLQQVDARMAESIAASRPAALSRRGMDAKWSWQKANAFETAFFRNPFGDPRVWTPGPNAKSQCNSIEQELDSSPWLCLSGGTDWQGFQGGYRCISEEGVKATWVTFKVRIGTPELSGAFFTLAGARHTWGLQDPLLLFTYRGDDSSQYRRSFTMETSAFSLPGSVHIMRPEAEVISDKPYEIAVHLDWDSSAMSVFIDGKQYVDRAAFNAAVPIRYAAIYNWRSGARTAFAELAVGNACPYVLPAMSSRKRRTHRTTSWVCPPRDVQRSRGILSTRSVSSAVLAAGAVALLAIGMQLVLAANSS